jgi:hypothetical protein
MSIEESTIISKYENSTEGETEGETIINSMNDSNRDFFIKKSLLTEHTVNCINLDRRTDKMEQFNDDYSNHPLFNVKRFKAIDTNSYVGCGLSHQKLVLSHNFDEEPLLIVVEDDLVLKPEFNSFFPLVLDWATENLNSWTVINCGDVRGDQPSFDNENDFIASVVFSLNTQFVIYSNMIVPYFEKYNPAIDGAIDVWIGYNVPEKKSVFPILTEQRNGFSDIEQKYKESPSLEYITCCMEKALLH